MKLENISMNRKEWFRLLKSLPVEEITKLFEAVQILSKEWEKINKKNGTTRNKS